MRNNKDFLNQFYKKTDTNNDANLVSLLNNNTTNNSSTDVTFISVTEFKTLKGVNTMDIISVVRKESTKKDFVGMFSPEGELLGFVNPNIDLQSQLTVVVFNDEDTPKSYYLTNKKSNNDIIGKL